MSLQSAQAIAGQFCTSNPSTGAAVNADSTPTGTLIVNGVDNGATVTITNPSTGVYKWAATTPTLVIGDIVQLRVTAVVSTITGKRVYPVGEKDLAIDAAGEPMVGALATQAKTDVQAALTAQGYTTARAPKLDNLDVASSVLQTAINNLNNLSALANLFGPLALEIPAAASIAYPFTLVIKDAEGHLVDLSGTPTVTAANAAGTDRSANLSAVTHVSTGVYSFNYTVQSTAAQEGISIKATGTAVSDSTTRLAFTSVSVVAVDVTATLSAIKTQTDKLGTAAADSSNIAAIKAKTDLIATNGMDSPNAVTAQGRLDASISSRPTASAIDTQLSGTHGGGAWGGSSTGTGAFAVTVHVTDGVTAIGNVCVRFSSTIFGYTDGSGNVTFGIDAGSHTLTATEGRYTYTPSSQTINANATIPVVMTPLSIAAASGAQVNGYLYTRDGHGSVQSGVTLHFELMSWIGTTGVSFPREAFTSVSDGTGLLLETFEQNARYRVRRDASNGHEGKWVVFDTPGNNTTFQLPPVIGSAGT